MQAGPLHDFRSIETRDLKHGLGSATLSVRLHTITSGTTGGRGSRFRVIEKSLPAMEGGRELAAYRVLSGVARQGTLDLAEHPHIFSIMDHTERSSVFMEHVRGEELNVRNWPVERTGRAMGVMCRKYGPHFPDASPFDRGRTANVMLAGSTAKVSSLCEDPDDLRHIRALIDRFNSASALIVNWQAGAKRVLCHNDVKSSNVIVSGPSQEEVYYFIDWAGVGWDSMGSDIGGVFFTKHYAQLEARGENTELESEMFRGYASGLEVEFTKDFLQQAEIAADLHFAIRFFSWSVRSGNRPLLLRSLRRAERVLRHFT